METYSSPFRSKAKTLELPRDFFVAVEGIEVRSAPAFQPFQVRHRKYGSFVVCVRRLRESWGKFVKHMMGRLVRYIKRIQATVRRGMRFLSESDKPTFSGILKERVRRRRGPDEPSFTSSMRSRSTVLRMQAGTPTRTGALRDPRRDQLPRLGPSDRTRRCFSCGTTASVPRDGIGFNASGKWFCAQCRYHTCDGCGRLFACSWFAQGGFVCGRHYHKDICGGCSGRYQGYD